MTRWARQEVEMELAAWAALCVTCGHARLDHEATPENPAFLQVVSSACTVCRCRRFVSAEEEGERQARAATWRCYTMAQAIAAAAFQALYMRAPVG